MVDPTFLLTSPLFRVWKRSDATQYTTGWCYDHRHSAGKFSNGCRTYTTDSAEIIVLLAVVNEMAKPLSPYVPTLAVWHSTLENDVMTTDTMLLSFPRCPGLPQLIQCSNNGGNDGTELMIENGKSPPLPEESLNRNLCKCQFSWQPSYYQAIAVLQTWSTAGSAKKCKGNCLVAKNK